MAGNEAQKRYTVARMVVKDNKQWIWMVSSQSPVTADDQKAKPFFDTFKME